MKLFFNGLFACVLLFAGLFFAGCASSPDALFFSDATQSPPAPTGPPPDISTNTALARYSVGDTVDVTLSDAGPDFTPQPYEQVVKEDGSITLPLIGNVQAAGKTMGELQKAIHDLFVPEYYLRLTVTVKSSDNRVFYVGGEVNHPGVFQYVADTTVTKAIQAAGGPTDFANHKKVWLIRATGERTKVNYDKALEEPAQDPVVYPDDQINIERRIW